jgi:transposase
MDSSPPLEGGDWPTPSRRTSRTLRKYTDYSIREISRRTGVPKSTVFEHIHAPTSRTEYKNRTGRKHKLDNNTIDKIIASLQGHYNERIKPWATLVKDWKLRVSPKTLIRELNARGYHKCKACQKGLISPLNLQRRFQFANDNWDQSIEYWKHVIFTDECHFSRNNKSVDYVIRQKGQRFCSDCIQIRRRQTKVEFSVWAAVGWNFKSPLIFYEKTGLNGGFTAEDYQRDILEGYIKPTFTKIHNRHYIIQEDNDGSHGTKTKNNPNARWKQQSTLQFLLWPLQSPDLSPIENVWRLLKSRVRQRNATSKAELQQFILQEWEKISQEEINSLILEMPDRLISCRYRNGFSTPY